MVRTRDTASVKVAGAKATRKITPVASTSKEGSDSARQNKYGGGNQYCPRETPSWQKPITNFFVSKAGQENGESSSSSAETPSVALEESEKTAEEPSASSSEAVADN